MDHGCGFVTSPWAAVLGHHAMASAGAAAAADAGFAVAAAAAHVQNVTAAAASQQHAHHTHHAHTHPHTHSHAYHPHTHAHHPHHPHSHHLNPNGIPMDLHVPQGFPYYRYREDALCWEDRKSMEEISAAQSSVNARILELRKEKSRDAARSRRGKENYEFYELAKMLPLPAAITSQLDKASIIRLTISYLKLRDFSGHGDPPWSRETSGASKLKSAAIRRSPAVDLFEQHQGTHILQSLDGFALAVAADGRFLYISETVSIYLGLSQVEMTGSSIFDYIHHGDHAEIAEQLGLSLTNSGVNAGTPGGSSTGGGGGGGNGGGLASPISGASDDGSATHGTNNPDVSAQMTASSTSGYKGYERSFCVRMKSTLTKRGCHFKSSGYRANEVALNNGNNGKNGKTPANNYSVVLLLCKLRPQYTFSHTRKSEPPLLGMVALAIALPPPSVHEIRLECDMFVTRINFDFKIAHVEPRVSELLDYNPEDLVNKSMYSLCHAEDANRLRKSHSDLIDKGQVLTGYFRFMNKRGGYTYMQCCATVVCSTKNADEQNIICVNYVISNCEDENLVMDACQLELSVDNIKHEELGVEKNVVGAASPSSSDAASEQPTSRNSALTPKAESEAAVQRSGLRGGRTSNTPTTVTAASGSQSSNCDNDNYMKIVDESDLGLEVDNNANNATTSPVVATPVTSKRKRKGKGASAALQASSDMAGEQQPLSKIAALQRTTNETPNSRLAAVNADETSTAVAAPVLSTAQHRESSVKDLEHAMSKHLPSPGGSGGGGSTPNINVPTASTTDFSADALLKQQQQQQQQQHHQQQQHQQQQQQQQQQHNEKSSTIQWIGTPNYRQPSPMPATALLRQLYANRESVIRATARQTPTGVFYGEAHQSAPLPTPPASESSYDQQYLQLHSHAQKPASDAFTNLVSTYGGYHSSIDYHNTMTPPSSVSPRDSNNSLNSSGAKSTTTLHSSSNNSSVSGGTGASGGYEYASDPLRVQYTAPSGSDAVPSLLLKPEPYSAAAAAAAAIHHPHNAPDIGVGVTYNNLDPHTPQPQYFTTHSSFHLYHKGASATGWYSTPS